MLHPEAVFLLIWYILELCQLKVLQKYGLLISQIVWCVCLLVFLEGPWVCIKLEGNTNDLDQEYLDYE